MTNPWKDKRVGVLMGGLSSEREISLKTGRGVHEALLARGYDAVALDWTRERDLPELLRSSGVAVVWIALHGTHGEDGTVQGLLECMHLPYTGSGVTASAVAMEKVLSKRLFEQAGVPSPAWRLAPTREEGRSAAAALGYPLVVKPSREGSTVGISIVERPAELDAALDAAAACHGETFLEAFVPGLETSVAILDGEVLGTVEIRPKQGTYDYAAKYVTGDTEYIVPAPLAPAVDAAARAAGLAAYRALGCSGHARTDVRVSPDGSVWVLEVNTLPGMTGTSLLPKIARHAGIDYPDLVERILLSASLRA